MSVRLLMRAWLRRASSFRRLSLCCSIILFSSSIVFRLHSIDEICFRVEGEEDGGREKDEGEEESDSNRPGISLHPEHWNLRVDIYLRLELHHVRFYLHVGFVQILNFVIQMFNILLVFNTCVNQSVSFSTSQRKKKPPHFLYKFSCELGFCFPLFLSR